MENSPKKPTSSSEPILDLKTDMTEAPQGGLLGCDAGPGCLARRSRLSQQRTGRKGKLLRSAFLAHSDPEEPGQSQGTTQDPGNPSSGDNFPTSITNSHEQPGPAPATDELTPGRDSEAEAKDPSSTDSLPWPEAPEECPPRPNTLEFCKSLKRLEEVKQTGQRRNSEQAAAKERGAEVSPAAAAVSEERRALQSELGKCIEDFRKIRIPLVFPNKKRQWQSELLKKYQL